MSITNILISFEDLITDMSNNKYRLKAISINVSEKEKFIRNFKNQIKFVLKNLTEKEIKVIKMRYGIFEYIYSYTLEEIGQELQVTRERVRQIQQKSFKKLRHPNAETFILLNNFIEKTNKTKEISNSEVKFFHYTITKENYKEIALYCLERDTKKNEFIKFAIDYCMKNNLSPDVDDIARIRNETNRLIRLLKEKKQYIKKEKNNVK